jgi:hypothetical protein
MMTDQKLQTETLPSRLVAVLCGDGITILVVAVMLSKGVIRPWSWLSVVWGMLIVSNYFVFRHHPGPGRTIRQRQRSAFRPLAWFFLVFSMVVAIVSVVQVIHGNSASLYQLGGALFWIALLLWLISRRRRAEQP